MHSGSGGCGPTQTPDDIDIPALRAKYQRESAKREGGGKLYRAPAQYIEHDPFMPPVSRPAVSEDVEYVIVGGGFGGLTVAADLKLKGVRNFRIVEMAGDFGGVWYWNRYPGARCDVESYSYIPLLEQTNYVPKERYSPGPEIFEHCQRIARHFGLYEHTLFGTTVRAIRWDNTIQKWCIGTRQGDDIRAKFAIIAAGNTHNPQLPAIPDIDRFRGHGFHAARWDYGYTGGGPDGDLVKLADKRVAVIGTGATAVQCIPFLARHAKHLYVFQRTPAAVDAANNSPTDPDFAKSLKPGWQEKRLAQFLKGAFKGFAPGEEDPICDGWSEINRNLAARLDAMGNPPLTPEQLNALREEEDFKVMERLRRRVESIVKDKETADLLKPWRTMPGRPFFSDDYLPTFNRTNVTLVDVSTMKGVERATETGLVAGGKDYPVDCIIYATGFQSSKFFRQRFGINVADGEPGFSQLKAAHYSPLGLKY